MLKVKTASVIVKKSYQRIDGKQGIVLATGGGSPKSRETRNRLRAWRRGSP